MTCKKYANANCFYIQLRYSKEVRHEKKKKKKKKNNEHTKRENVSIFKRVCTFYFFFTYNTGDNLDQVQLIFIQFDA